MLTACLRSPSWLVERLGAGNQFGALSTQSSVSPVIPPSCLFLCYFPWYRILPRTLMEDTSSNTYTLKTSWDFPGDLVVMVCALNTGALGLIPGQKIRSHMPQLNFYVLQLRPSSARKKKKNTQTRTGQVKIPEGNTYKLSCDPQRPARCLCPWDSPSNNSGVDCHFLSRGSSQPRNWTWVSCVAGKFFTDWALREAPMHINSPMKLQNNSLIWVYLSSLVISFFNIFLFDCTGF